MEVEPELVEFMKFVRDNTCQDVSCYTDERIREMYQKVQDLKRIGAMEDGYMASEWWLEDERDEARSEGWEEGRKEGREEGRKEGREEGRKEGRKEGQEEGENRMAALIMRLRESGREDEVAKAAMDVDYRKLLYTELGL